MSKFRRFHHGLIMALLGFAAVTGIPGGVALAADAAEALRPEIGKQLQAAQALLKEQKYQDALIKIQEAESVSDKTPYEMYIIERLRGSAAAATGNNELAIKSYEDVVASGRLPPPEQIKMIQAIAGLYYRAKNYPKTVLWASRYIKEGGTDAQMSAVLAQAYYLNGDFPHAATELQAELQANEKADQTPPEERLKLLASCYLKTSNSTGYTDVLEKLVTYYPSKDYWADLISRIEKKQHYDSRLDLDVFRLKATTGNLAGAGDFMEMSQLSMEAGFPIEAKKIIDQGFSTGVLGTGADANRQKKLRDLVTKNANDDKKSLLNSDTTAATPKESIGMVNIGYNYVVNGQFDKGISLMEKGLAKGGLKHPEEIKLRLGTAYLQNNQKEKAVEMFKTVQGADGTKDLARLWGIYSQRKAH